MYTIGQFSKICKVTVKALRHYEKIGLITPDKVEESNKYRYYSKEQVSLIKKISFLKELGVPLKLVKQIIDKETIPDEIKVLLEEHRKILLEQLDLCNSRLVKLAWWEKTLEGKELTEAKNYDIRIRGVAETPVRSLRKHIKAKEIAPMIRSLLEEINSLGGVHAGPPIMLFFDEDFNPENMDMEAALPVLDVNLSNKTLPAVLAATCIYVGPYDGLEDAYEAVFAWINQNGYRAEYPTREISYNDPQTTPPEQLVTEIIVPVTKV
ncbi:DNA-binding transcriptional MerR regulator [Desulfohalotomaculum tongense]|uniref:MerR family transcriptional regulator n=1 Tax=Desulforadius tongensis TaxID=1216062 RepID=UPI001957F6A2|nr:MerR family transcriptional regulator [Desulforadius tongensis]MBM7854727.1 DNA-binding transcriptional MerR regulator [Desulforadius tongensis]